MIMVSQIRLSLDGNKKEAIEKALKKSRITKEYLISADISRVSVDARKNQVHFVYSVAIYTTIDEKKHVDKLNNKDISYIKDDEYRIEKTNYKGKRPVIIGFGPAGMFCGLVLANAGIPPLILEKGADIDKRVKIVDDFWKKGRLSRETNVQFGEGGAGTFSDGKLTTRIKDPRCHFVLKELIRYGAPKEIGYKAKPHVGTDKLRAVVKNLRKEIERLGGEVRFETSVTDIEIKNNKVVQLITKNEKIEADRVILAVGHSARDIFETLHKKNIGMEAKPFSVGVRVEHLQLEIERGIYKKYSGHSSLPKGEYQLSYRDKSKRGVYSFCMCPGGIVVPSSSFDEEIVTNGMSKYLREEKNANSAIVVSVTPEDFGKKPLDGVNFQKDLERKAFLLGGGDYRAPAQTLNNFMKNKPGLDIKRVSPSYLTGVKEENLRTILPDYISNTIEEGFKQFERNITGFSSGDSVLTGVETRTSSPVRIIRDEYFQSPSARGLYPAGEGPGYAGGIMSAATDGIKIAEAIINEIITK